MRKSAGSAATLAALTILYLPAGHGASLQDKIQNSRQQLQNIHQNLGQLRAHLAAGQKSQAQIQTEIQTLDRQIAAATTRLKSVQQQRNATQQHLAQLKTEVAALQAKLEQQRAILAQQLRAAYMMGGISPLAAWLQTERPAQLGRMEVYYRALAKARSALIVSTQATAAQLQITQTQVKTQEAALDTLAQRISTQENTLQQQRTRHAVLEKQLAERIAADRARIQELQANARQLDGLIQRLVAEAQRQERLARERAAAAAAAARRQAAAEAARRAAEARVQARERGRQTPAREAPPVATPPRVPQAPLPPSATGPIVGHGTFPPPVSGPITARFGSPRVTGGLNWQGITFQAAVGTPVHAIAPGMVLYSGPLRGYGEIVIVQQGRSLLAIYGHLGATSVHVGEKVSQEQEIGSVGSGGELGNDGLYFEMRNGGHPVNPLDYIHN
ncbi:murein hydrolase activator EnvC family protein [Acidithiobacillus sp.]